MPPDDPGLDRIFERAGETPPPGLEERILAGLADPAVARRFQLEESAEFVRRVLRLSLAVFVVAALLVAALLVFGSAPASQDSRTTSPSERAVAQDDELAVVVEPVRRQGGPVVWPAEVR